MSEISAGHAPPRIWMLAGGVWLLLLVLAGAFSWRELARGRLDTDLFALIPAEQDDLLKRAMSAGRGDVLFWLHPVGASEVVLDPALAMLEARLERSGLFAPVDDQRALLATLQRYRFQMLSASDRALLLRGADDQVAQQGLEQLASPMPTGQFAKLADDPLGTFERAMLERLQGLGAAPQTDSPGRILRMRLKGDALDFDLQARAESALLLAAAHVRQRYPGVQVDATGLVRHATANAVAAQTGMARVATLSTLLVLFMAWWAFRRVRPALLMFVPVLAGTAAGYAAGFALFERLHVLTLVFGATLVGSASDYAFHYLCARTQTTSQAPTAQADMRLARQLAGPLLWSAGSAALGYACMAAAGVGALAQIAVIGGVGLVAAAISILLWFPLLCLKLPAARLRLPAVLQSLRHVRPARALLCTLAVGAVAVVLLLVDARLGNDLRVLDASPVALRAETARVSAAASGIEPGVFLLLQGADETQLLQREQTVRSHLDAGIDAGELGSYIGVSNLIAAQAQQQQDWTLLQRLWRTGGAAQQLLAGMQADDWLQDIRAATPAHMPSGWSAAALARELDGLWLGGVAATSGSEQPSVASTIRLRAIHDLPALRARIAQAHMVGVQLVDIPVRLAGSFALLAERAALALLAAIVLIALGLVLWARSLMAVRGILPVAVSVLGALAMADVIRGQIDVFQILGAFLVLALATDFVILTLTDDDERTVLGMLLGALATGGSFLLLVLLPIPAVQGLGIVVAGGTLLALVLTTALRGWLRGARDGGVAT